jgi:predicted nucleic acid-binding protein
MPPRQRKAPLPVGRSLYARAILADTGAFLALANSQNNNHHAAVECLKAITRHRLPVFVLLPTIYESYNRFLFDLGQRPANHFIEEIYDGSINIVRTIEEDEFEA